jgi:hypothetical protein
MAEPGCLHDAHFQNLEVSGDMTATNISLTNNGKNVNRSLKTTDRYYLDEYFLQRPAVNDDINAVYTDDVARAASKNFELKGTSATTAGCTFGGTRAGILITTAGQDEDQVIILPHLDTNQTAWTGVTWGTGNQVEWECCISLPAIVNQKVWAGLKKQEDQVIIVDTDQAFFKFQTDNDNNTSELFANFDKLHFIHSIAGVDFISELPITVAANTNYHLKIVFDSARKVSIFVNGIQYNITSTSGSTGTAVTAGTTQSGEMTDVSLIPYIGIEAGATATSSLNVYYQSINRVLFK